MERSHRNRVLKILAAALFVIGAGVWIFRDALFQERSAFESHVGSLLPDAVLTGIDRKEIRASDLLKSGTGDRAVLILWATWCEPCVREIPLLEKAMKEYESLGIQVHLVNYDGPLPEKSIPEVKAWFISQGISLTSRFEFSEEILKKLDIGALPFAIGLDAKTSKISWMRMGELPWDQPEKIQKLF